MPDYDSDKRPSGLRSIELPIEDDDVLVMQRGNSELFKGRVGDVIPVPGGTIEAGETISGHMAIVAIGGLAYKADPTNLDHLNAVIGVSKSSATAGNPVQYAAVGEVGSASFVEDANYFVGEDGMLSTDPIAPGAVWLQKMGRAKTASILIVDMDGPIRLEE